MSPLKQSARVFSNPMADDLVFLLFIVSSPNRFIAEREHNQAQNVDDVPTTQSSGGDGSSTWERKLSSLPIRRRGMILSLQRLANARQKWTDSPSREKNSDSNGRFELEERLQNNNEADALEEVESVALDIRVVEQEVYDETELEQNKENHVFLNGEPSSQIVTIGPSIGAVTESDRNHQEN